LNVFNIRYTNKNQRLTDYCKLFNSAQTCIHVFPDAGPRGPKNLARKAIKRGAVTAHTCVL
jgi:hypothetical protein